MFLSGAAMDDILGQLARINKHSVGSAYNVIETARGGLNPMARRSNEDGWIATYTNGRVHPLNLVPSEIDPVDVVWALSHRPRFLGHTKQRLYVVAQHACLVSRIVEQMLGHGHPNVWRACYAALHHDVDEAYLPDIPSPIKTEIYYRDHTGRMSRVSRAYEQARRAFFERVGAPYYFDDLEIDAAVKRADLVALVTEARDLMHGTNGWQPGLPEPMEEPISVWEPPVARVRYMARWGGLNRILGFEFPA